MSEQPSSDGNTAPDPRMEWAQIVVSHLTDVFAGRCSITLEQLQALGEESPLLDVLAGIYYLNDELTNRERQRAQAVKDLEATLDQLKAQHAELLASRELTAQLSTPLMRAGRGVLMLPLLGTLDEERTQLIVSSVLSAIKEERAQTIILHLTGVDSVDVRTAQFLSRMVGAAGLLGTKTVLAGISPQVAQAMVQINIDTRKLITVRDLADALRYVGLT